MKSRRHCSWTTPVRAVHSRHSYTSRLFKKKKNKISSSVRDWCLNTNTTKHGNQPTTNNTITLRVKFTSSMYRLIHSRFSFGLPLLLLIIIVLLHRDRVDETSCDDPLTIWAPDISILRRPGFSGRVPSSEPNERLSTSSALGSLKFCRHIDSGSRFFSPRHVLLHVRDSHSYYY